MAEQEIVAEFRALLVQEFPIYNDIRVLVGYGSMDAIHPGFSYDFFPYGSQGPAIKSWVAANSGRLHTAGIETIWFKTDAASLGLRVVVP